MILTAAKKMKKTGFRTCGSSFISHRQFDMKSQIEFVGFQFKLKNLINKIVISRLYFFITKEFTESADVT